MDTSKRSRRSDQEGRLSKEKIICQRVLFTNDPVNPSQYRCKKEAKYIVTYIVSGITRDFVKDQYYSCIKCAKDCNKLHKKGFELEPIDPKFSVMK